MEGARVIVRCYGDEPRICVVYKIKNDRVLITNQDGLSGIKSGTSGPFSIGFPRCDVFEYSIVAEMQIKQRKADKGKFEWGQLKPFML